MTEQENPGGGVLERARKFAKLTHRQLWLSYLGLGGDASPVEVESYLAGGSEPTRREYNILAHALNERLMDLGLATNIQYAA